MAIKSRNSTLGQVHRPDERFDVPENGDTFGADAGEGLPVGAQGEPQDRLRVRLEDEAKGVVVGGAGQKLKR